MHFALTHLNRIRKVVRMSFLVGMVFARVHAPPSNICIPRSNENTRDVIEPSRAESSLKISRLVYI
jgi:hypothetical protein